MQGRKENEQKKYKKIDMMLQSSPSYMKNYLYSLRDKSYTTKERYVYYVLDFIEYLNKNFNIITDYADYFVDVKPSMIDAYFIEMDAEGSSKACRFYGIKSFFNFLARDGYIENNPCNKLDSPKDKKEHKITSLTKDEIEIIQKNILNGCGSDFANDRRKEWKNRDYAIIMLGLSLGLRVTSISEINIQDIDFNKRTLQVVEKGNKTRSIKFSSSLKQVLQEWFEDRDVLVSMNEINTDALFISSKFGRLTSRAIYDIVKKYTNNIDKHITPHKLRSTCATLVYNKTGDIYLTAHKLGHNNISTTKRYVTIDEEREEVAAQAMDDILF